MAEKPYGWWRSFEIIKTRQIVETQADIEKKRKRDFLEMFIRWSHKMISHMMLSRSPLKESSARVFRWEIFWKERQCLWNILDMVSRSEWYSCFTFLFKNGRCKSSLSASSWNNARVEQDDRRWREKVMHREFLPNLREKILWETSNNRMIHGGEDKRNGSQNWY